MDTNTHKSFIDLSLKEIFINLITTIIDILNDILDLKTNEFSIKKLIIILSKDDRLIYVGMVLIIISILLFI
jgi:hypothetical protein